MAKTALVTIPQAVSAVATKGKNFNTTLSICCYNTASGKRCCNASEVLYFYHVKGDVTIPQAVSAVATKYTGRRSQDTGSVTIPQAVSAVATLRVVEVTPRFKGYNTASGKRCCNSGFQKASIYAVPKGSFGKPQTVNGKFSPHQVLEGLEAQVNTGGKPFF